MLIQQNPNIYLNEMRECLVDEMGVTTSLQSVIPCFKEIAKVGELRGKTSLYRAANLRQVSLGARPVTVCVPSHLPLCEL
jgi:hypothetical protein